MHDVGPDHPAQDIAAVHAPPLVRANRPGSSAGDAERASARPIPWRWVALAALLLLVLPSLVAGATRALADVDDIDTSRDAHRLGSLTALDGS